jgi:hypothetical protein
MQPETDYSTTAQTSSRRTGASLASLLSQLIDGQRLIMFPSDRILMPAFGPAAVTKFATLSLDIVTNVDILS